MRHISQLARSELVEARFWDLIKLRFPWLVIGLIGGLVASLIVSHFELSLRENIALAFFIPVIAYMSDAIGTQTETIFIRALTDLKFSVPKYILREFYVGATLGLITGVVAYIFAYIISWASAIALVVGVSLFLSMTTATVLACLTPIFLKGLGKDPAVAAGPFTTALQDVVSLTIYFVVASLIL